MKCKHCRIEIERGVVGWMHLLNGQAGFRYAECGWFISSMADDSKKAEPVPEGLLSVCNTKKYHEM